MALVCRAGYRMLEGKAVSGTGHDTRYGVGGKSPLQAEKGVLRLNHIQEAR